GNGGVAAEGAEGVHEGVALTAGCVVRGEQGAGVGVDADPIERPNEGAPAVVAEVAPERLLARGVAAVRPVEPDPKLPEGALAHLGLCGLDPADQRVAGAAVRAVRGVG